MNVVNSTVLEAMNLIFSDATGRGAKIAVIEHEMGKLTLDLSCGRYFPRLPKVFKQPSKLSTAKIARITSEANGGMESS